jgi:hypothetical protein
MKTFTEWLKNDSKPCGVFNPPLEAQKAINFLKDYLLAEDWYSVNPVSAEQINTEIVFEILCKYSRKFRKEWKKYKKNQENGYR